MAARICSGSSLDCRRARGAASERGSVEEWSMVMKEPLQTGTTREEARKRFGGSIGWVDGSQCCPTHHPRPAPGLDAFWRGAQRAFHPCFDCNQWVGGPRSPGSRRWKWTPSIHEAHKTENQRLFAKAPQTKPPPFASSSSGCEGLFLDNSLSVVQVARRVACEGSRHWNERTAGRFAFK